MTARELDRRDFIKGAGAAAALAWARPIISMTPARASTVDTPPFEYGVASGDPFPGGITLWTRAGTAGPLDVGWEIALDRTFSRVAQRGAQRTDASRDHTVVVHVDGLRPETTYWYRFSAKGRRSRVGRTRTAPAGRVPRLRFAVTSCHEYQRGYYGGWRHIAGLAADPETDLDFVLFLGDYIYEGPADPSNAQYVASRAHKPAHECFSLADYRTRYRQYRSDPDLRDAHATYPFASTWDDHEIVDLRYRDGAPTQPNHAAYLRRRAAGFQTYFEYMPIRRPDPRRAPFRIYRTLRFGPLADLMMLDLRTYRDPQVGGPTGGYILNADSEVNNPKRTILGAAQKRWFKEELKRSRARWRLIGNPTLITSLNLIRAAPDEIAAPLAQYFGIPRDGFPTASDAWEGYMPERREVLEFIRRDPRRNIAFFTGDLHTSIVSELYINPGNTATEQPVGVEFVGPSLTSENFNEFVGGVPPDTVSVPASIFGMVGNPHVKYLESDNHGYVIVDVTPARVQAEYFHLSDIHDPRATVRRATGWQARHGDAHLTPA